ncbi:MAG: sugar transferase [Cyclobacteriaceae bacterium]
MKIALVSENEELIHHVNLSLDKAYEMEVFSNGVILYNALLNSNGDFQAILSEASLSDLHGLSLKETIDQLGYGSIPFFLILEKASQSEVNTALKSGITDLFFKPLNKTQLKTRVDFQISHPKKFKQKGKFNPKTYKSPWAKRLFDVLVSSAIFLVLSPLFLVVAILIKLESKGPVFYYSLRVGTGYNIFKFYKFRSMNPDADSKLHALKHLNQYKQMDNGVGENPANLYGNKVKELCEYCEQVGGVCLQPLYDDEKMVCEKKFVAKNKGNEDAAFIKIKNDPRVTKIGKFIRNTSIDELPQLWNVLKGDMSLVGNRPLPLYEAEKITTDKYALRFLGPAGITGLWQVEKRGKGEMSEEERLSLDNDYVKNFTFWFDIKILLRTIPALFQTESV